MAVHVKSVKTGKVYRMSKNDAKLKVATGRFTYAPKSEYQRQRGNLDAR